MPWELDIIKVFYAFFILESLNYEAESHLVCGTLESAKLLARLHFKWFNSQKTVSDPGYFLARIMFQYEDR
jgi:hypothetical protein